MRTVSKFAHFLLGNSCNSGQVPWLSYLKQITPWVKVVMDCARQQIVIQELEELRLSASHSRPQFLHSQKEKTLYGLPHWLVLISTDVKVKVKSLSHVRFFVTPWTVAHQTPPSVGFSRQECWSGLPFPSHTANSTIIRRPVLRSAQANSLL